MQRGEHFPKMDVLIAGIINHVSRVVFHDEPHESTILVQGLAMDVGLQYARAMNEACRKTLVRAELSLDF